MSGLNGKQVLGVVTRFGIKKSYALLMLISYVPLSYNIAYLTPCLGEAGSAVSDI